jgi:hypothetical protein
MWCRIRPWATCCGMASHGVSIILREEPKNSLDNVLMS